MPVIISGPAGTVLVEEKPVRTIPGPAGIVQAAKLLKQRDIVLGWDGAVMSTQEYMKKVVEDEDFKSGAWGDIKNFLKNGKLEQVVAIIKSCTLNALGDLTVIVKDLSVMRDEDLRVGRGVSVTEYVNANGGIVRGCLGDIKNFLKNGKLEQVVAIIKSCTLNALGDLTVTVKDLSGSALILANVSVFSFKPSMHYLNITMKNVVKVFYKDSVPSNNSGVGGSRMLMEEEEIVKLMEEEERADLELQVCWNVTHQEMADEEALNVALEEEARQARVDQEWLDKCRKEAELDEEHERQLWGFYGTILKENSSQRNKDDKNGKGERKCFKCGDPNHLIGECPKLSKYQNQKAFVGGSWSDSDEDEEEKTKDEKCLMAKTSNEVTKMPKATTTDISLTKSYIPKVSKIPGISPTIAQFYKPIENRNIHEGRVVDQAYYKSNNIERLFTNIRFNCLFQINEPIVPRFILDFYSQVTVQTDDYGYLVISFMIQHEFITLTLAQFGQILKIPYNGQAVFTNEWDLASLEYSQETKGPYCTDLPTPNDIRRLLELERVVVDHTIKRGHRDRLPACLAHMLYCVVAEEQYNLAYFFVKRIECAKATPTANLPYGMFLTRLYLYVIETYPHLDNGTYDIVERVMRPLALRQTQRPRSDRGKARGSVSSLSSHHQGTSSHQLDDDDDDVETSRASTLSPTTYLNSLHPLDYQNYQMPSSSEQTDETLFARQTTLLN
ncbi:pentatricopeptide repeat-containing protein [Tanacetum coccineum]